MESATRLALLAAITTAADDVAAALLDAPGAPEVAVRIAGDGLHIAISPTDPTPEARIAPAQGAEASARISLRLSEARKADIESAARAEEVSINAWLVRAATHALATSEPPKDSRDRGGTHDITGWING